MANDKAAKEMLVSESSASYVMAYSRTDGPFSGKFLV